MLIDFLIFIVAFVLGGAFVFFGMHGAIRRELLKPPLSDEEKDERAFQMLAKAKSDIHRPDYQKAAAAFTEWAENSSAQATADGQQLSRMI